MLPRESSTETIFHSGATMADSSFGVTNPLPNALAYRIPEVRLMGGPGKTRIYELAAEGKLRLVRVGGRTLIDGDSLRSLLREGC
jgi:hypothetical protein